MDLIVRGTHDGKPWHELMTLTADTQEQVLDWLEILPRSDDGSSSVAGAEKEKPLQDVDQDVATAGPDDQRTLSWQYRPRASTGGPQASPISAEEPDGAKTPTRHEGSGEESHGPPGVEGVRPDSGIPGIQNGSASQAQAPPPPVHQQSPSSSSRMAEAAVVVPAQSSLAEAKASDRLKRRGSSLKHEYLPSDTSTSDAYSTEESESSSSDDDIESVDVPETDIGVSIKQDDPPTVDGPVLSAWECSLTVPSSASHAGLPGDKTAAEDKSMQRFAATISRWSDKGTWKDIDARPCHVVVTAGKVEAYMPSQDSGAGKDEKPLLALDLTPLVLIRQSTGLDLEIRSSVQAHCQLRQSMGGGNFRLRCQTAPECFSLYMAVHQARLNSQKFIELENETRFKSFGEYNAATVDEEARSGRRRRGWFGRNNSYRSSVRAPSRSQDGGSSSLPSTASASSLLKRLTLAGNLSFNIARSSVDRQRPPSRVHSLYNQGSSSSGGTPLRSPSISIADSSFDAAKASADNMQIRLHLLVAAAKWEDCGNCRLQIRRPPPGWHQALRVNHGLEKRVTATTRRKETDEAKFMLMLDAVLGSGCFSPMGSRGIVCGVWEEVKDGHGVVGMVPATGATGGSIKKWCFQFATVAEASWVLRLLHQEVVRA